jgi:hypothetical protein
VVVFVCVLVCILLIISYPSFAEVSIGEAISRKAEMKRNNPNVVVDTRDIVSQYDPNSIIAQAIRLTEDPNEHVKKYGYGLLAAVGKKYQDLALKKEVVCSFVEGLTDSDESIVTTCAKLLFQNHQKEDFSDEAKAKLRNYLDGVIQSNSHGYYAQNVILLIGVADIQGETARLQTIIEQVNGPLQPFGALALPRHEMVFAALKAKARMGDEDAVERCIALVDSVEDEEFRVVTLLKHIQYIRQPKAVEYIKGYLYSDKKQAYAGPDAVVYSYSWHAASYLEEMIAGFPTKKEIIEIYLKRSKKDESVDALQSFYSEYCQQWIEKQERIEIIR